MPTTDAVWACRSSGGRPSNQGTGGRAAALFEADMAIGEVA
ncbi:hypothetical protein [Sorangium atrum]|uniref:Uncharacterized protein n=1 Tax=Sorangium atrum TaxID=2995308 RepID=A0ABT5CHA0_9BACT|nr:hypothetical protein [Sorangium aterium]MDC0685819.1 hypothetical protein [Sorangium aterium]